MVCLGPADNDRTAANAKPTERAATLIFILGLPDTERRCYSWRNVYIVPQSGSRGTHVADEDALASCPRAGTSWEAAIDNRWMQSLDSSLVTCRGCRGGSLDAKSA